jgi:hypothetical protein
MATNRSVVISNRDGDLEICETPSRYGVDIVMNTPNAEELIKITVSYEDWKLFLAEAVRLEVKSSLGPAWVRSE